MKLLKGLLAVVVVLAILVAGLFGIARFLDGPLALIPGGPLRSGERVTEPVRDWSFARDVQEIELQLESQQRSRTTWIVVHEGRAYIPVSLSFPPGKSWHHEADRNGAALLRIQGRLYPVELSRLRDEARARAVGATLLEKYTPPPGGGGAWLFEIRSRGLADG